jgi:hypothetical protein
MTRGFLRSVCRALIGVVLLAQVAISAYACPGVAANATLSAASSRELSQAVGAITGQQMVNCDDMVGAMDPSFANLCAEHCRQGQQSDQTATLTVPAALLAPLYITLPAPEPTAASRPAAAATSALAAAAPPHAILHCCFRI